MRAVHFATVGKSIEPVVRGFRLFRVDRQVLLHSRETREVALAARDRICGLTGTDLCELEEIDPFDLRSVIAAIVRRWKKTEDAEFFVNITGGTNIMASAALVAGFVTGARVYYVKEVPDPDAPLADQVVVLPVPRVPLDSLDGTQRRILLLIGKHRKPIKPANLALATALRMSPQIISYHLKQLERKGLITLSIEGRNKVASLTPAGDLFAAIL